MFTKNTVFVLGAGASLPYGYPSGAGLVKKIAKDSTPGEFVGYLQEATFSHDQFQEFQKALDYSQAASIDAFLEHRQEFIPIGKFAIAYYLMLCEVEANLFNNPYPDASWDHWYPILLDALITNPYSFGENKIAIVTFNYDRSLEQFLFVALQNRYGWTDKKVAESVSAIPILHVHGKLARFPWQEQDGKGAKGYVRPHHVSDVQIAADGIKIISEDIDLDESPDFAKAQQLLKDAKTVFFLGFGYHQDNMRRLAVPLNGGVNVYGTCYGFTEMQVQVFRDRQYMGLNFGSPNHRICEFLRSSYVFLTESASL